MKKLFLTIPLFMSLTASADMGCQIQQEKNGPILTKNIDLEQSKKLFEIKTQNGGKVLISASDPYAFNSMMSLEIISKDGHSQIIHGTSEGVLGFKSEKGNQYFSILCRENITGVEPLVQSVHHTGALGCQIGQDSKQKPIATKDINAFDLNDTSSKVIDLGTVGQTSIQIAPAGLYGGKGTLALKMTSKDGMVKTINVLSENAISFESTNKEEPIFVLCRESINEAALESGSKVNNSKRGLEKEKSHEEESLKSNTSPVMTK